MKQRLEKLLLSSIEGLGYQLWGIEYLPHGESAMLRIYIDAPAGITVEDCAAVSHQAGAVLDVEDVIPVAYTLEVSSPGMDRLLFNAEHFQAYVEHTIKVRTRAPIEGRRNFRGRLTAANESMIEMEVDNASVSIGINDIDRARVVVD